jgi:TIR domain
MAASIFISYAGRDLKTAAALCQALEAAGFSCWMASRDIPPGENFQIAIVRAIRAAQVMVLVFTQHSNHSEEVAKELALASQTRLPVVPLRMEEVLPNEAFAYEFATRQWIDFSVGWDAAMAQLRQRLGATLELTPSVEVVALTAPRPPRAMRKRSPLRWVVALILTVAAVAVGAYVVLAPHPKPLAAAPVAAPPAAARPPPPPAETNEVPF